jgi:hypothetical protein
VFRKFISDVYHLYTLQYKGNNRNAYKFLVETLQITRPFRVPSRGLDGNIKMELRGNHYSGYVQLTQHRLQWQVLAGTVMRHQEFVFLWLYSPSQALAASMKLSVSLQLLDLGQSVGLLGQVISSSQGLYLYMNTEKRTHNTNTKHPCPEWDTNPRSRRPRERRHFMP